MQVCNKKETSYIFSLEEAFLSCRLLESYDFEVRNLGLVCVVLINSLNIKYYKYDDYIKTSHIRAL